MTKTSVVLCTLDDMPQRFYALLDSCSISCFFILCIISSLDLFFCVLLSDVELLNSIASDAEYNITRNQSVGRGQSGGVWRPAIPNSTVAGTINTEIEYDVDGWMSSLRRPTTEDTRWRITGIFSTPFSYSYPSVLTTMLKC